MGFNTWHIWTTVFYNLVGLLPGSENYTYFNAGSTIDRNIVTVEGYCSASAGMHEITIEVERCILNSNSYTYTDDNFGAKSGAGSSLTSRVSIEEFRLGSNIMGGE